jgi:hypothetical protein
MPNIEETLYERHNTIMLPTFGASATPMLLRAMARNIDRRYYAAVIIAPRSHPTVDSYDTAAVVLPNANHTTIHVDTHDAPALTATPTLTVHGTPDSAPLFTVVAGIVYTHFGFQEWDSTNDQYEHVLELFETAISYACALNEDDPTGLTISETDEDHPLVNILHPDPIEVREQREEIDRLEQNRVDHETRADSLREQVEAIDVQLRNRQNDLDTALAALDTTSTESPQALADYLTHQPLIDSWFMPDTDSLRVITGPMNMQHPDNPDINIPVGAFAITLQRDGAHRCVNLTDRRGSRDHPHIVRGSFCTGAYAGNMRTALRAGRITDAINLLLNFLQTFNPHDDYGRTWTLWQDSPADLTNLYPETEEPSEVNNPNVQGATN